MPVIQNTRGRTAEQKITELYQHMPVPLSEDDHELLLIALRCTHQNSVLNCFSLTLLECLLTATPEEYSVNAFGVNQRQLYRRYPELWGRTLSEPIRSCLAANLDAPDVWHNGHPGSIVYIAVATYFQKYYPEDLVELLL